MLKLTGGLEQEIINILWERNCPLVPAEVQEILKPKKELAYTTVMTVLQRLYTKKIVHRERRGMAYAYYPALSKEAAATDNLKTVFDELLTSYGDLAISRFIDSVNSNQKHKGILEQYLKEHEKQP